MIKTSEKLRKITAIYIASLYDVETITESGQNAGLTFKTTKDWAQLYITDGSLSFNEAQKHPNAGIVYDQELKITMPGDDSSLQNQIDAYLGLPIVLRFDYDDGTSKILGSLTNWIDLNSDFSSQNWETKRVLTFKRTSSKPALFLQ